MEEFTIDDQRTLRDMITEVSGIIVRLLMKGLAQAQAARKEAIEAFDARIERERRKQDGGESSVVFFSVTGNANINHSSALAARSRTAHSTSSNSASLLSNTQAVLQQQHASTSSQSINYDRAPYALEKSTLMEEQIHKMEAMWEHTRQDVESVLHKLIGVLPVETEKDEVRLLELLRLYQAQDAILKITAAEREQGGVELDARELGQVAERVQFYMNRVSFASEQRILDLSSRLQRTEARLWVIQAKLAQRGLLIKYIEETLYKEVVGLREQLLSLIGENNKTFGDADVKVFSFFDFVKLIEASYDAEEERQWSIPNYTPKHRNEKNVGKERDNLAALVAAAGLQMPDALTPEKDRELFWEQVVERWQKEETVNKMTGGTGDPFAGFRSQVSSLQATLHQLSGRFTQEMTRLRASKLELDKQAVLHEKKIDSLNIHISELNEQLDEKVKTIERQETKLGELDAKLELGILADTQAGVSMKQQLAVANSKLELERRRISQIIDRIQRGEVLTAESLLSDGDDEEGGDPALQSYMRGLAEGKSTQDQLRALTSEVSSMRREIEEQRHTADKAEHLVEVGCDEMIAEGLPLPEELEMWYLEHHGLEELSVADKVEDRKRSNRNRDRCVDSVDECRQIGHQLHRKSLEMVDQCVGFTGLTSSEISSNPRYGRPPGELHSTRVPPSGPSIAQLYENADLNDKGDPMITEEQEDRIPVEALRFYTDAAMGAMGNVYDSLRARVHTECSSVEKLRDNVEELRSTITDLKIQKQAAEEQHEKQLKAKQEEAEETAKRLQDAISEAEENLRKEQNRVAEKEKQLAGLKLDLTVSQKEIQQLNSTMQSMQRVSIVSAKSDHIEESTDEHRSESPSTKKRRSVMKQHRSIAVQTKYWAPTNQDEYENGDDDEYGSGTPSRATRKVEASTRSEQRSSIPRSQVRDLSEDEGTRPDVVQSRRKSHAVPQPAAQPTPTVEKRKHSVQCNLIGDVLEHPLDDPPPPPATPQDSDIITASSPAIEQEPEKEHAQSGTTDGSKHEKPLSGPTKSPPKKPLPKPKATATAKAKVPHATSVATSIKSQKSHQLPSSASTEHNLLADTVAYNEGSDLTAQEGNTAAAAEATSVGADDKSQNNSSELMLALDRALLHNDKPNDTADDSSTWFDPSEHERVVERYTAMLDATQGSAYKRRLRSVPEKELMVKKLTALMKEYDTKVPSTVDKKVGTSDNEDAVAKATAATKKAARAMGKDMGIQTVMSGILPTNLNPYISDVAVNTTRVFHADKAVQHGSPSSAMVLVEPPESEFFGGSNNPPSFHPRFGTNQQRQHTQYLHENYVGGTSQQRPKDITDTTHRNGVTDDDDDAISWSGVPYAGTYRRQSPQVVSSQRDNDGDAFLQVPHDEGDGGAVGRPSNVHDISRIIAKVRVQRAIPGLNDPLSFNGSTAMRLHSSMRSSSHTSSGSSNPVLRSQSPPPPMFHNKPVLRMPSGSSVSAIQSVQERRRQQASPTRNARPSTSPQRYQHEEERDDRLLLDESHLRLLRMRPNSGAASSISSVTGGRTSQAGSRLSSAKSNCGKLVSASATALSSPSRDACVEIARGTVALARQQFARDFGAKLPTYKHERQGDSPFRGASTPMS